MHLVLFKFIGIDERDSYFAAFTAVYEYNISSESDLTIWSFEMFTRVARNFKTFAKSDEDKNCYLPLRSALLIIIFQFDDCRDGNGVMRSETIGRKSESVLGISNLYANFISFWYWQLKPVWLFHCYSAGKFHFAEGDAFLQDFNNYLMIPR